MQKGTFFLTTSFRIFQKGLLGFCFLYFSLVAGSHADCPLQINPQSVVVRFGDPVSVNCSTSVQHNGTGWESTVGVVPLSRDNLITWGVSNLTEWNIEAPFCYINLKNGDQCELALPVTVYKTPDSVSISTGTHTGPMTEGQQYELQCDVHNVAPVQNLTVRWYKGQTLVDQTSFNDTIRTPVNETTKLLINPDGADDGVQYRCEAELDLGEEGPQPPPTVTSQPLNITVYFKPTINDNKPPSKVTLLRGSSLKLVCEAEGNPKPYISWSIGPYPTETLIITESAPEILNCTATNSVGSTTRQVEVVFRENYTLLIVFIILAVVGVILFISICRYITYKKSRKGQYDLRKPIAPKGLLAEPAQSP